MLSCMRAWLTMASRRCSSSATTRMMAPCSLATLRRVSWSWCRPQRKPVTPATADANTVPNVARNRSFRLSPAWSPTCAAILCHRCRSWSQRERIRYRVASLRFLVKAFVNCLDFFSRSPVFCRSMSMIKSALVVGTMRSAS